jgi:predicted methyltransferase
MTDSEAKSIFKEMKRILCPGCKGEKVQMYLDKWDEREERTCHVCDGEGIVFEITEKLIKKINNGRKNRELQP